jgi:hypothetical protein
MKPRALFSLVLAASLLVGCMGSDRGLPLSRKSPFQVPTKDDVLWVDGRRLSLSGYTALRESLPPGLSRDTVLWLAIAALSLQNDALLRGTEIPLKTAVTLARFADGTASLTPEMEPYVEHLSAIEFKSKIERIINKSVIQRNPLVLAELH